MWLVTTYSDRNEFDCSDTIIIEFDEDFKNQGWSGNGTSSNPYVLANEIIEGDRCIWIRDTTSYFRVDNCTLIAEYQGIILSNVTNAVLIDCVINSKHTGIVIDDSYLCEVVNNSIEVYNCGFALTHSNQSYLENNTISCKVGTNSFLHRCINTTLLNNTILGGTNGVTFLSCSSSNILNNTIASTEFALQLIESTYNSTIIGNQLGSVETPTAIDDGIGNLWDDGISLGNAWFDYQGIGDYQILGTANNADHFPTKFDPSFPMDFEGPLILASLGSLYIDYCNELPSSYRFTAIVNDTSGVDTVIMTVNGIPHKMTHQPSESKPDLYVYDHPMESWMVYSYWANDTIGLSSETPVGHISAGVMYCPEQFSGFDIALQLLVVAIVSVIALVLFWKIKK
ncbi:MAG: right-handed parallel beta-helix repeat-containing protein [Candidatus Thorarchaeota archaeon]|nr:right-handed parallel beta-helix repeat-containing protein [Candidatus Thorarchaeota archaeon]